MKLTRGGFISQMKIERIISFLIACLMLVCLVACGNSGKSENDVKDNGTTSEISDDSTADNDKTTEEIKPSNNAGENEGGNTGSGNTDAGESATSSDSGSTGTGESGGGNGESGGPADFNNDLTGDWT